MAVTVEILRGSSGNHTVKDTYAAANHIEVSADGHLSVEVYGTERLAVYAPKTWRSAYLNDSAKVNA